ncbi:hypothetical protein BGZ83_009986 [Gryganskiella cystojenkinii]|nr:hypothetical protein BGZ83_009986 [Gryganskiella cystojenkinii]
MSLFSTDSGFRPPSPITINASGPGLFDEPTSYPDLFSLNSSSSSTPSSLNLPQAASAATPLSQPDPATMSMFFNSTAGASTSNSQSNNTNNYSGGGGLFNPSEQKYFSEFLDKLVVDQSFAFDPTMIPNLPNLPMYSSSTPIPPIAAVFQLQPPMTMPEPPRYPPSLDFDHSTVSTAGSPSSSSGPLYDTGIVLPSQGDRNSLYYPPLSQPTVLSQSSAMPSKQRPNIGTSTGDFALGTVQDPIRRVGAPLFDSVFQQKEATHKMSKLTLEQQFNIYHGGDDHTQELGRSSPLDAVSTLPRPSTPRSALVAHRSLYSSTVTTTSSPRSRARSHSQPQSRSHPYLQSSSKQDPPPVPHLRQRTLSKEGTLETNYSSDQYDRDDYQHQEYEQDYASDTPLHLHRHQQHRSQPRRRLNSSNNIQNIPGSAPSSAPTTTKRKPYKELLTEEEKRANHIASEQKRRNTIRNGFRDMTELIPDLKDLNSSKSTILFKAVDFIHTLEKRNRSLRRRAEDLESKLRTRQQQQQQHSQQDLRPRSPPSPYHWDGSPDQQNLLPSPPRTLSSSKKHHSHLLKHDSFSPYSRPSSQQSSPVPSHYPTPPLSRQLQPSYHPSDRLQDIPHLYPMVPVVNR